MNILIIGGFGYGNLGDEAILAALLNRLGKNSALSIELLSKNPTESAALHGRPAYSSFDKLCSSKIFYQRPVKLPLIIVLTMAHVLADKLFGDGLFPRSELAQVLKKIREADVVISCGGGFFNDGWYQFYPILFEHVVCARLNGNLLITSQSIGGFRKKLLQPFVKYVLKKAKYFSVRDETSLSHVKRLGITAPVVLTRDDAVDFRAWAASTRTIEFKKIRRSGKLLVGLTLQTHRPYISREGRTYGNDRNGYYDSVVSAVSALNRTYPLDVLLLPSTAFRNDLRDAHYLGGRLKKAGLAVDVRHPISPDELFEAIGLVDLHISSNLHPVVFAACQGIPFLAVSYSTKIDDFVNALQMNEYLLRIDQVTESKLLSRMQHLLANRSETAEKLRRVMPTLQALTERNFLNIQTMLNNGGSA